MIIGKILGKTRRMLSSRRSFRTRCCRVDQCVRSNGKGRSSTPEAGEVRGVVDHDNNDVALERDLGVVEMNVTEQKKEDQIPGSSDQKLVAQKTSGNLVQRRLDHSGF